MIEARRNALTNVYLIDPHIKAYPMEDIIACTNAYPIRTMNAKTNASLMLRPTVVRTAEPRIAHTMLRIPTTK